MPRFAEATDGDYEDEDEDEEDGGSSGGSTSSTDSDDEAAKEPFPLQKIMGQAGVHKDGTRASLDAARIGIKTGEEAGKETEVRPCRSRRPPERHVAEAAQCFSRPRPKEPRVQPQEKPGVATSELQREQPPGLATSEQPPRRARSRSRSAAPYYQALTPHPSPLALDIDLDPRAWPSPSPFANRHEVRGELQLASQQ